MYLDLVRGLRTNENGRLRAAVYLNVTYSDPSSSESHFPYRQLSKQREIKHITLSKHIELSKPTGNQTTWWTKRLIYRGGICGEIGRGNKSSTSTWLHPKVRGCGYYQMQSLSASTPLDSEVPTQWATFGGTHPCTRRSWSSHATQRILTNCTYTSPVIWKLLSLLSVPRDVCGGELVCSNAILCFTRASKS